MYFFSPVSTQVEMICAKKWATGQTNGQSHLTHSTGLSVFMCTTNSKRKHSLVPLNVPGSSRRRKDNPHWIGLVLSTSKRDVRHLPVEMLCEGRITLQVSGEIAAPSKNRHEREVNVDMSFSSKSILAFFTYVNTYVPDCTREPLEPNWELPVESYSYFCRGRWRSLGSLRVLLILAPRVHHLWPRFKCCQLLSKESCYWLFQKSVEVPIM